MAGKTTNGKTNKHTGDRNPQRTNGKAWKKSKYKPAKVRTPERQAKDEEIRRQRLFKNASAVDKAKIKKIVPEKTLLSQYISYIDEGGPGV